MKPMGTLYIVATPIGNLEDISPRALRILREVTLIAAEDTRHTKKLLEHFDIHTELVSYFEHNKISRLNLILEKLAAGDVALVSDAGTPAINDPGYELVKAALASNLDVRPVPGPSAPVSALSVSGLPTDSFLYLGYLPHKKNERRAKLGEVSAQPYTLIFLESPHRIVEALEDILATLGDREICVAREMTKLYEEYWRGQVKEAVTYFSLQPARGEFTLIISGNLGTGAERWGEDKLNEAIAQEQKAGKSSKDISSELSLVSGWSKREIYNHITRSSK